MRQAKLCWLCALLGLCILAAAVQGQDGKAPASDKEGLVPAPFTAHIVVDQRTDAANPMGKRNFTGKEHCLITESELNPTLAIFSGNLPTAESNLTKLTKAAKELQQTYKAEDFNTFIVFHVLKDEFATDTKADQSAAAIRKWAETVKPGGVALALGSRGPDDKPTEPIKAWKLNGTGTTVALYNKHALIKRWDFADEAALTDEVIATIATDANKEMKRK